LSVLLSYSVVKEPTSVERAARVPDPSVRVKRNVSHRSKPFRLTRTPICCSFVLERSRCGLAAQGLRSLGRSRCFVNHRVGNCHNLSPLPLIPASRSVSHPRPTFAAGRLELHKSLCNLGLLFVFSKIKSRAGTTDNGVGVGPIPRFGTPPGRPTKRAPGCRKAPPEPLRNSSTVDTGPRRPTAPPGRRSRGKRRWRARARLFARR
jgi:hypothetical protein